MRPATKLQVIAAMTVGAGMAASLLQLVRRRDSVSIVVYGSNKVDESCKR
jgi:hypothetical protein